MGLPPSVFSNSSFSRNPYDDKARTGGHIGVVRVSFPSLGNLSLWCAKPAQVGMHRDSQHAVIELAFFCSDPSFDLGTHGRDGVPDEGGDDLSSNSKCHVV